MKTTAHSRQPVRTATRKLMFQNLEARSMMAGDVTAAVVGNSLVLSGDNADNGVKIAQFAPGKFIVSGLSADGQATTINGQSAVLLNFSGGVQSNLGNGDDLLLIDKPPFAGTFFGNQSEFDLSLVINDPSGDDQVTIRDVIVNRNAVINLGDGDDLLQMERVELRFASNSTIGGILNVDMGEDDDTVLIDELLTDGSVTILMGEDDNDNQQLRVIDSTIGRGFNATMGEGDDLVLLYQMSADSIALDTGDGEDLVTLDTVSADEIFLALGGDDDAVNARRVRAEAVTIDGEGGDDVLTQPLLFRERIVSNQLVIDDVEDIFFV